MRRHAYTELIARTRHLQSAAAMRVTSHKCFFVIAKKNERHLGFGLKTIRIETVHAATNLPIHTI